jgi:hypothetical protein
MIAIVRSPGQLGNKLFLFAHFIGFAIEHKRRVINLDFDPFAKYFEATASDLLCSYPANPPVDAVGKVAYGVAHLFRMAGSHEEPRQLLLRCVWKAHSGCSRLNVERLMQFISDEGRTRFWDTSGTEFIALSGRSTILMTSGWLFRGRANFQKHAAKIREMFAPVPAHRLRVDSLIDKIRAQANTIVGVHIRRRDYANFLNGHFFYSFEQYAEQSRKVATIIAGKGKPAFLICSDEQIPIEAFRGLEIFLGTGHELEDMYALAQCDFLTGPPSTYSGWASYYGSVPWYMIEEPGEVVPIV